MLMAQDHQVFVTIKEAAALLRVSTETIRRMIQSGELFATRVRGQWRIYKTSVTPYLNQSEPKGE